MACRAEPSTMVNRNGTKNATKQQDQPSSGLQQSASSLARSRAEPGAETHSGGTPRAKKQQEQRPRSQRQSASSLAPSQGGSGTGGACEQQRKQRPGCLSIIVAIDGTQAGAAQAANVQGPTAHNVPPVHATKMANNGLDDSQAAPLAEESEPEFTPGDPSQGSGSR